MMASDRVFFDIGEAKALAKKQAQTRRQRPITWRDIPRVCLPGWLIRRTIGWLTTPLYRAGPAICLLLERHIERLADNPNPKRFAVLLQSAALWLTQSPNGERLAILEQMSVAESSQSMPDPLQAFAPVSSQFEGKE
jgi:hypothetical protein